MTLTITFSGIAEVDKHLVTFLSISHDVYAGGELYLPCLVQSINAFFSGIKDQKYTDCMLKTSMRVFVHSFSGLTFHT